MTALETVKQALDIAAETLRAFDEGDQSSETGWKHDELLDAWKQCQAALEALSGMKMNEAPR